MDSDEKDKTICIDSNDITKSEKTKHLIHFMEKYNTSKNERRISLNHIEIIKQLNHNDLIKYIILNSIENISNNVQQKLNGMMICKMKMN